MNSHTTIDELFQNRFASIEQHLDPDERKGVRPEQRKVIESILDGHNTLALMPTGSGKSLCYWIAGLALKGITLVIFPLTALMDEQATKLEKHGCSVFVLHSGIGAKKQYDELMALYNSRKKPDFIFVSPERLATDGFLEFVLRHIRTDLKLVVIDEAHCISQWGFDFRPFYKEIPAFLDNVFGSANRPLILGLTATLNTKDRAEICQDFQIDQDHVVKSELLLRQTITVDIVKVNNEDEKDERFWDLLEKRRSQKMLVYIDRKQGKRSVSDLCAKAQQEHGFAAEFFHGDLTTEHKAEIIRRFKANEITLVFATSAFGMGIDIPDIRGVVHYLLPESIEQYYQQIGRVGRDSQPAWAVLFYSDKNVQVRKTHYIEKSFPSTEEIKDTFQIMTNFEVGKKTFNYFNEEPAQHAYHYLIKTHLVKVICKGIRNLSVFETAKNVKLSHFEQYQTATKKGGLIQTAKKVGETEVEIVANMFQWLAEQKIKAQGSPEKILVIESFSGTLPDETLNQIQADVTQKKQHRHALFDEFVQLLEHFTNSIEMHQEIGIYLGVDKFYLDRICQTLSGDMVKSKSELIIADKLFKRKIPFKYEQTIYAPDNSYYNCDFTIEWQGQRYLWEHWGRRDLDEYRNKMEEKIVWYNKYFPGQLISTYETSTLSREAENLINQYFPE